MFLRELALTSEKHTMYSTKTHTQPFESIN